MATHTPRCDQRDLDIGIAWAALAVLLWVLGVFWPGATAAAFGLFFMVGAFSERVRNFPVSPQHRQRGTPSKDGSGK